MKSSRQTCQPVHSAPRHHVTTGVAVLLLFLQMSSSFLVAPVVDALCLHETSADAASPDHDHHGIISAHRGGDSGNSFQHCKETEAGVALTPAQPFALAAAAPIHLQRASWTIRIAKPFNIVQNILPALFQPPRV